MIPVLFEHEDIEFLIVPGKGEAKLSFPFHSQVMNFLFKLSERLLKAPQAKLYPELVALGYWIRKANLTRLQSRLSADETAVNLPVGTFFHVAPSNLDIQFFYSWVLSVLMGNINIVRVSQVASAGKNMLLDLLALVLSEPEFRDIACSNVFVTWPHNDEFLQDVSAHADARMLRGSASVTHIRRMSAKLGCRDVVFADKYSVSLIDSSSIADEQQFVDALFRDISAFSQQACSSPRVVLDCDEASGISVSLLHRLNQKSPEQYSLTRGVNQLVAQQMLAASGALKACHAFPGIQILELTEFSPAFLEWHSGESQLFWVTLASPELLVEYIDDKCQTISYSGLERHQLLSIIDSMPIT